MEQKEVKQEETQQLETTDKKEVDQKEVKQKEVKQKEVDQKEVKQKEVEQKEVVKSGIEQKQPKQFDILHEDNHILVVVKPQNIPSQEDASGDLDLLTMVKAYIKEKYNKPGNVFTGLVHRLDRPTGGVMVFAKTSKAAARLSDAIKEGDFEKRYFAVVCNRPKENTGHLVHYLKKNEVNNVVYLAPSGTIGAKRAELVYSVLEHKKPVTLLSIKLLTGRGHQIRVQMNAIVCPVFGDAKYGGDKLAKGHNLALWATELKFTHPVTNERMTFISYPPESLEPWKHFDLDKYLNIFS